MIKIYSLKDKYINQKKRIKINNLSQEKKMENCRNLGGNCLGIRG